MGTHPISGHFTWPRGHQGRRSKLRGLTLKMPTGVMTTAPTGSDRCGRGRVRDATVHWDVAEEQYTQPFLLQISISPLSFTDTSRAARGAINANPDRRSSIGDSGRAGQVRGDLTCGHVSTRCAQRAGEHRAFFGTRARRAGGPGGRPSRILGAGDGNASGPQRTRVHAPIGLWRAAGRATGLRKRGR